MTYSLTVILLLYIASVNWLALPLVSPSERNYLLIHLFNDILTYHLLVLI